MTENAKNPTAQNPSKADAFQADAFHEYESTWKGFNQIQAIVNSLPMSTYEEAVQYSLGGIQDPYCLDILQMDYIRKVVRLDPRDAINLIMPLAEQLSASPDNIVLGTGDCILNCCKKIESLLDE